MLVACQRPSTDQAALDQAPEVAPVASAAATSVEEPIAREEHLRANGQLGPGKGTLLLSIQAPAGAKLTEGAPIVLEGSGQHVRFFEKVSKQLHVAELPLRVPIEVLDGASEPIALNLKYYWCTEGKGAACRPERVKLLVDLDFSGDAAGGEAFVAHQPRIN